MDVPVDGNIITGCFVFELQRGYPTIFSKETIVRVKNPN